MYHVIVCLVLKTNIDVWFPKLFVLLFVKILKPSEKKAKYQYSGLNSGRPVTPPKDAANKKK